MVFLSLFPLFTTSGWGRGRKWGGLKRNVPNGWKPSICGNIPFSIRIGSLERFAGKWECAFSTVDSETLFQLCKPPWFWVAVLLETFVFLEAKRNWYPNCLWLFKNVFTKISACFIPVSWPNPVWVLPSCLPGVTFSFSDLPLLLQILYNVVSAVLSGCVLTPKRSNVCKVHVCNANVCKWWVKQSSVYTAWHLLGILCYHFNKPAKVPW